MICASEAPLNFKTCSCGETYLTEEVFLVRTSPIGLVRTMDYMDQDLELRNCSKCFTTLTRLISKTSY